MVGHDAPNATTDARIKHLTQRLEIMTEMVSELESNIKLTREVIRVLRAIDENND